MPDSHLIHGLPVSVGILLYSLHPRPNLMHSVHQLSSIFQNLGPPHLKAVDHCLRCLAGLIALPFVLGNQAEINKQFSCVSHGIAAARHQNPDLNYIGITGIAVIFLGTVVHMCQFRLQNRPVRVNIMSILKMTKLWPIFVSWESLHVPTPNISFLKSGYVGIMFIVG